MFSAKASCSLGLLLLPAIMLRAADPGITGELSGVLGLMIEGAPKVEWRVRTAERGGPQADVLPIEIIGDGPGTKLRGEADIGLLTGLGTWKISEARLGLGAWLPVASARLGDALEGFTAEGEVVLSGAGRRTAAGLEGTLRIEVANGAVRNEAKKISAEGISLVAELTALRPAASAPRQILSAKSVTVGAIAVENVRLEFELTADGTLKMGELTADVFGGKVRADAATIDFAAPALETVVRATALGVDQIVKLLPPVVSDAHGHVDGEMGFSWSADASVAFKSGRLALTQGDTITFRLSPQDGLITGNLNPPEMKQWQLALRKVTAGGKMPTREDNPAYPALHRVEMGETPLRIDTLAAEFYGAGDARTVRVRIDAQPIDPNLKAPLVVDVNVSGPLDELVKLGLNEKVSFGVGK